MSARFTILNPCQKRHWDALEGGGRARHCSSCDTKVHAIAEYSAQEWAELWRANDGHVCGYMDAEARVETSVPHSRRVLIVGALLTLVSPLLAQNGRLRIRVTDITGAVIPNAEVSLMDGEKVVKTQHTDANGESVWTDLAMGRVGFRILSPGFNHGDLRATILDGGEQQLGITLLVGSVGTTVKVDFADFEERGAPPVELVYSPVAKELDPPTKTNPSAAPTPKRKRRWIFW